ncbi:MAG: alpha/beta hydrolase [Pseudomonadota bacterium]
MPSPESEEVLRLNNGLRDAWLADPEASFDELRLIFEQWLGQIAIPKGTHFEPVDCDGVPGIWASVPGADPGRVIVHYHSGGYILGSAHGYRSFGGYLSAATGCKVLLADYRLAPENPYPAGVEDGIAVVQWLLKQGISAQTLALCGDSGGGGLVLSALQAMRDRGIALPCCGIAISPVADFARTGASYKENAATDPLVTEDFLAALGQVYCGDTDPRTPGLSPLYGDWTGLPPLLILAGEIEMMRDDGKLCVAAAVAQGVDATYYEGKEMAHIWTIFADRLPEAREALQVVGQFVRHHMADPT